MGIWTDIDHYPYHFLYSCIPVLQQEAEDYECGNPKTCAIGFHAKKTLGLILVIMVLVIIPVFANMFVPNPATAWFASKFNIKVLCTIGIVFCCAWKLADTNQVIRTNIPWPTIIMVCGMSTMINMAVETGIADLMGGWLGSRIPAFLIIPMIISLGGLLSFVTTGPAQPE